MQRKYRVLGDKTYVGDYRRVDVRNGSVVSSDHSNVRIIQHQSTWSESHAWPKDRGVRDVGGPFDTVKLTHRVIPEKSGPARWHSLDFGVYDTNYVGDLLPYYGGVPRAFTLIDGVSGTDNDYYSFAAGALGYTDLLTTGTKFVAASLPTNPTVDGSVALAELFREGIPHMVGSVFLRDKAHLFRTLGDEYLNVEFGWKPLISDLKNAAKAIMDSHEILTNLAENSGRDLKRRRISPPERKTVIEVSNNVTYPAFMPSTAWALSPTYSVTTTTVRQQWFSGCFVYYYEPERMNTLSRIATQARLLYGLKLTPEVLWELAPWSWLVDWVANVGPVLKNLSAFQQDGLVMKYGYVMEHVTTAYRRTNITRGAYSGLSGCPSVISDVFLGERKRREKASPYGFGLVTSAFTNRQWSILGALGLTRAPKVL